MITRSINQSSRFFGHVASFFVESVFTMSYSVQEAETTVFLEDIDTNYNVGKTEGDEQSASQSSQPGYSQEQKKSSNKRQRTIEDMFFGPKKATGIPKKAKLSDSNDVSTSMKIAVAAPKLPDCRSSMLYPFHYPNFGTL